MGNYNRTNKREETIVKFYNIVAEKSIIEFSQIPEQLRIVLLTMPISSLAIGIATKTCLKKVRSYRQLLHKVPNLSRQKALDLSKKYKVKNE